MEVHALEKSKNNSRRFFSVAIYISVGSTLPYTEHSCIYM